MPPSDGSSQKALSAPSNRRGCLGGALFMSVFFAIFMMAGGLVLWMSVLGPAVNMVKARTWNEVPCTITGSEVVGDDTYRVKITYNYQADGRDWTGDRYSFTNLSTSGRAGKQKIVDQYPVGQQSTCFVDPGDVSQSVINRNPNWQMLWGLMSLPFLGVGIGGLFVTARGRKPRVSAGLEESFDDSEDDEEGSTRIQRGATRVVTVKASDFDSEDFGADSGPVTLQPEGSNAANFIVTLIIALIYNGVLTSFIISRLPDWAQLRIHFVGDFFLFCFTLGGVGLALLAVRAFLAMYNPVPLLTMSRATLPLGSEAHFTWEFHGSTKSIRSLKFTLKGYEEARYRRGTNTHTDRSTFHEQILFETTDATEIASGRLDFTLPANSMHSFLGGNNSIKWQLQLAGEISMWPDVLADFPLRVAAHE